MTQINKKEFLQALSKKNPDLPKEIIQAAYEQITDNIKIAFMARQRVVISGFGSFIAKSYTKSSGKSFGLLFHPSAILKNKINKS